MNDKQHWMRALTAMLMIGIVVAACGGDDEGSAASTTTSLSTSTTPTSSSTTTTTTAVSTTTRSGVPVAVDVVKAGPSAGSGEISLRWDAAANATGYRVLRANAAGGPFSVSADFDITTGKTTAGADVTNIFSQQYSYKPTLNALARPDSSPCFEYIETVSSGIARRYFRVVAYNAGGDAPPSAIVCGDPINRPAC